MKEEFPTNPDYFVKFESKPNILTLLSGGIFFAVLTYFISDFLLNSLQLKGLLLRFILPVIILLISLNLNKPDTWIHIYPNSGKIIAEGGGFRYEAEADEPELFMVLQKKTTDPRTQKEILDYKLSLKADEETTFEIMLPVERVKVAITAVEKAKESIAEN